MRGEKRFRQLFEKLNPEQKRAVEAIEGPVMVVAGPGTGKTHVLTMRMANILRRTDANPENLLALTFTEAAAREMRERLGEIIGDSIARRAGIFTFHGFCNSVIREYPERFPGMASSDPVGNAERLKIGKEILESRFWETLSPLGVPLYYLRPLLTLISSLKREGITEEEFGAMADDRGAGEDDKVAKNREVAVFFADYRKRLAERGLYDYEDMIVQAVRLLASDENVLRDLQERFQYILADEHQDANRSQNMVLELLGSYHPNPNLFVVGDAKQAIFRFQGASLENFRFFQKRFPSASLISLERNYRSSQSVLNAAFRLADELPLRAVRAERGEPVELYEFQTEAAERFGVCEMIRERAAKGGQRGNIAVLCRTNEDAEAYARALQKRGIPASLESEQNVFGDPFVRLLCILLRVVHDPGDGERMQELLHSMLIKVDLLDTLRIHECAGRERLGMLEALKNAHRMDRISPGGKEEFLRWYRMISSWHRASVTEAFPDIADKIIAESGLVARILARPRAGESLERIGVLLESLRTLLRPPHAVLLKDAVEYLSILEEEGVACGSEGKRGEGVRVMTAHKAKGREFDFVFIVRAQDTVWGGRRIRSLFSLPSKAASLLGEGKDEDEERRLFFVALTRARRAAFITWARRGEGARERTPSRFCGEIGEHFAKRISTERYEEEVRRNPETGIPIAGLRSSRSEKAYVRGLFEERALSVTALNNYLACPWKYFYMNLVRIPRSPAPAQIFGTAVHGALREFFQAWKKGEDPGERGLGEMFEGALFQQILTNRQRRAMSARGVRALQGYYKARRDTWPRNILLEVRIPELILKKGVRLTGMLDKVEIGEEGSVHVVDYKTGKPKSRNEIEGKTKNATGDQKRQLVFYKLLVDKSWEGMYCMESGEIDFVEPTRAGTYKRERFEISPDEVKDLREKIFEVADDIRSVRFWNRSCEDASCEFCKLRFQED